LVLGDATNLYDGPVKILIQGSGASLCQLQLGPVVEWLNVDLPRTQNRRVDLLGRMPDGRLLHIELQSTNDGSMPFRMAEYALAIMRRYGQYPVQLLLYVGNQRLRMRAELRTTGMVCQYRLVDIRSLDASVLLASDRIEDNILAVLAGMEDSAEGIRFILLRIAKLRQPLREEALHHLLVTCGIRGLARIFKEEIKAVPLTFDLSKDELFASYGKSQRRKGREEGQQKGRQEGRQEGVKEVVQLQLEKRFGRLPASIAKRVAKLSDTQAHELALAIIDAKSLQELFGTSGR